jgi:predicted TIM-barrel fold metal-dependent hydrolase
VPYFRIARVLKSPGITEEQRVGVLDDNAAKLLTISLN